MGFQVDAFIVLILGFVVLWWFENWIVDASKMRNFCFDFFAFINFNRLLLLESLDRFVIV